METDKTETREELATRLIGEVVAEAAAADEAMAKAPPPKSNVMRFLLDVPEGHVLPLGEAVKEAFVVTVVAGARWHPEWDAPRIGVNVFRILTQGDALCWSGESAKALPLPLTVKMMANHHGDLIDGELAMQLGRLGLTVPDKPEPLSAFRAVRATDTYRVQ